MPWIDSHCHCTDEIWRADPVHFFQTMRSAGCEALIQGGIDPEDWKRQLALPAPPELTIIPVFGLHPWTVLAQSPAQLEEDFKILATMLPQAGALGETGLDFFRGGAAAERKKQTEWFSRQLDLARQHQKPCVLHLVRAYPDAFHVYKKHKLPERGLLHSFWAPRKQVQGFIDDGWLLSVHPRILRGDPHGILTRFPREQLVFESDAPFPTVAGGFTSPALTWQILQHVANMWSMPPEELAVQQRKRLSQLFPLFLT